MRINWSKTLPGAYAAMKVLQNYCAQSKLEPKLRELIKIRASQINGCVFCLDMHTKDAQAIGEDNQRMHVLAAWREAPFYSPRERAGLEWCEALTLPPQSGAPDNVYLKLEEVFQPEEIVELTFVIVAINC